jgi:type II secretory pathway pseudopilin PulG
MMDKAIGVVIAIVGVASLAVVVSKKSDTAKVLDSLLGGLGKLIRSAVSPVTGQ